MATRATATTNTTPTNRRKEKEPPLSCKCKEGRCVECRLCPRRSCKVNRCTCLAGPTRLRVPKKRKLGEIIALDQGNHRPCRAADSSGVATNATSTNNQQQPHNSTTDLLLEPLGIAPVPTTPQVAAGIATHADDMAVLPATTADWHDKVLRYKPLEFAQDVVEALQLPPQRQILSRFQRRKIATEGILSMQSAFEKQCCKRTVQTFQDAVQRIAELLLPEAPEYLLQRLPQVVNSSSLPQQQTCRKLLQQVSETSPRKSVQSRTARAVLAAATADLPHQKKDAVTMTKYVRKIALKDWELLQRGDVLSENKSLESKQECRTKTSAHVASAPTTTRNCGFPVVAQRDDSGTLGDVSERITSLLPSKPPQTFDQSSQRISEQFRTTVPAAAVDTHLTIAQEAMLAMMKTMPAPKPTATTTKPSSKAP